MQHHATLRTVRDIDRKLAQIDAFTKLIIANEARYRERLPASTPHGFRTSLALGARLRHDRLCRRHAALQQAPELEGRGQPVEAAVR